MKSDPSAETPDQNGKFSLAAILANLFVTSKLTQLFILACLLLGLPLHWIKLPAPLGPASLPESLRRLLPL